MVPEERDDSIGRAPPGRAQLHSRFLFESGSGISRMEAGPSSLPTGGEQVGSSSDRSLCDKDQHPVAAVHLLEARPIRNGGGCNDDPMDGSAGLRLPALLPLGEVPTEDCQRAGNCAAHRSSLGPPALVPCSTGGIGGDSHPDTSLSLTPLRSIRPATPTTVLPQSPACRLEGLRGRYASTGISEQATGLITAGWSQRTNTAYQSAWSRWQRWCGTRDVDPFSAPVTELVNFLGSLFSEGLQYRSINTVRSAVSVTHPNVGGIPIGQHPLITRLMKGIYNSRPPAPRYTSTWDVGQVTTYLKSLGPSPSLKHLTLKLAMLMALVDANRTSELAALDLRFKSSSPEGVSFTLAALTKKRMVGAPPRRLFFGGFPHDRSLCVVSCLKEYEARTQGFRNQAGVPSQLFLSYVRPHAPVSSQRIANWLKMVLKEAGIDTSVYSAHSTRGASATAAAKQGIPFSVIMKTADWARESTFRRFYYRPDENLNPAYAQAVLNS